MSHGDASPELDPDEIEPTWDERITRFVVARYDTCLATADRLIRDRSIDQRQYGPDDAIQDALLHFRRRGTLDPAASAPRPGSPASLFARALMLAIIDEHRRQQSSRRDGDVETASLNELKEAGFDRVDPAAPDPAISTAREEALLILLDRLGDEPSALRTIAVLRMRGFTLEEISSHIGRPVWEIKRMIERIRDQLRPHHEDH